MDEKVLNNLSHGVYVITTNKDGIDNGCITNSVAQVTADPITLSVAINKDNLTCEMIDAAKKFTVSILSQSAKFDIFQHFGFQSGRDVDKFASYPDCRRISNGTMIVTVGTNAYISADVIRQVDFGSHILFFGKPTEGEVLNDDPSATYAYYFSNIKPKPVDEGESSDGQAIWRCTICGYEYVGEGLLDNFICPVCKHPASD